MTSRPAFRRMDSSEVVLDQTDEARGIKLRYIYSGSRVTRKAIPGKYVRNKALAVVRNLKGDLSDEVNTVYIRLALAFCK